MRNKDCKGRQNQADAVEVEFFESIDDGSGVIEQSLPGYQTGENYNYRDVKNGANDERGQDSDGHVALRILAFFGGGRDGIKANVREKNDRATGENAGPAIGRVRMPICWMNKTGREADKHKDGDDFEQHHNVVGARRFLDAANQDNREQHDDDECRPIETEMPAGSIQHISLKILKPARQVRGRNPFGIGMHAKPIKQIDDMLRKSHADGHIADSVNTAESTSGNAGRAKTSPVFASRFS